MQPFTKREKIFYQDSEHLDNHIKKFHVDQEEEIPINLNDYMDSMIVTTSYQESSSLQKYFNENYCIKEKSFPYSHQRDAIKKIITMACSKKEGVISISKAINTSSFQIFFAIAQIAFLANEIVIKYLCIILSLVIPLWRQTYKCPLEIPTTPIEIGKVMTSNDKYSI